MKAGKLLILILGLGMATTILANHPMKSTGLLLRGSYWHTEDEAMHVSVISHNFNNQVDVGRFGGSLTLFSRTGEQSFFEISIGSVSRVKQKSEWFGNENTRVHAISPILMGIRYNLFSADNPSMMQPYLACGGGPYWLHDIQVSSHWMDESVTDIESEVLKGAYVGGGLYLSLTKTFVLNMDMRYHFIDLDPDHEYSGLEFSMGFGFMWGNYNN